MDEDELIAVVVQGAVVDAMNNIGQIVIGPNFTPVESSPIPDGDVADAIREVIGNE